MAIKGYSKSEPFVFIWIMLPYVIGMNLILFGPCLLKSLSQFCLSFLYSCVYLFLVYFVFGTVAVRIRKLFPTAGDLFKRISVMLPVFYVMNVGAVNGMILLYKNIHLLTCSIQPQMMWWGVLYGCIMSTAITFINEGMANFEAWKSSLNETERLKNLYQRSKLIGLKGQINPHFLFNCFNTLSGLIQEDESKAEKFLDEMTKVHRYLLRSDDDMLVPLEDELKFASSYLYLTKERFGKAVEIDINVSERNMQQSLPPLSMQVVLENIIYTNAISKNEPLKISIHSEEDVLSITHSVHEKKILENLGNDEGLDNLVNKYVLLKAGKVEIFEDISERTIQLPLIKDTKQ
jgi:LytS/YehU family sensor histidine kinase